MNRFIAVATEINVLNLVALRALVQPGDQLLIFDDPRSAAQSWGERLQATAACFMGAQQVRRKSLPDWRPNSLVDAVNHLFSEDWPGEQPTALHQLLIGGRKHPALLLHELLYSQCGDSLPLYVHSVERRPFRLETSGIRDDSQLFLDETPLSALGEERVVTLDEVLTLHGYRRTTGRKLAVGKQGSFPAPQTAGELFEQQTARLVARKLAGYSSWISELWLEVEIVPLTGGLVATEFDVLVLARDGSTVHFECKGGGTGGVKALTSKVFHQRRAFTPESRFVLCKPFTQASFNGRDAKESLVRQYQNLGDFNAVVWDPACNADKPLPGLGSANEQVRQALDTAWANLLDTPDS